MKAKKKQSFRVMLRVEVEVEDRDFQPYQLTEAKVVSQLKKLLKGKSITEGLPCSGATILRVTDCIED